MSSYKPLTAVLVSLLGLSVAHAAPLVEYQFSDPAEYNIISGNASSARTTWNATSTAANVSSSVFQGVGLQLFANGSLNTAFTSASGVTNLRADTGDSMTFTLTAASGFELDLSSLTFDVPSNGNNGNTFSVDVILDGGTPSTILATTNSASSKDLDLTSFANASELVVQINIDSYSGSNFQIDNVVVNGEIIGGADVEDDTFDVTVSGTTNLNVLANDLNTGELDLSSLQISSSPTHGTATVLPDGSINYLNTSGTLGSESFDYSVDNSAGTVTYSATVTLQIVTVIKTINSSLNLPDTKPVGGFQFEDAFPGLTFTGGTCLEHMPGSTENLFVTEKAGQIWLIPDVTDSTHTKSLFLDITGQMDASFLAGLRGLAFHPDFATNRYFYVAYNHTTGARVSRFTANASDLNEVDSSTEIVLLSQGDYESHGINRLIFGPDGYLYIAIGDSADHTTSQKIDENFWSSVLRIDVDKKVDNYEPVNTTGVNLDGMGKAYYSVPADNPYIDTNFTDGRGVSTFHGQSIDPYDVRTEMFSIGFRNPWKIGFVPNTTSLWVTDAAHGNYEKYAILPKGSNSGWGYFEGTYAGRYQIESNLYPPAGSTYVQPVMEYRVTGVDKNGGTKSIVGGAFYTSNDISEMTGSFVFGDNVTGDIWYMTRPDHTDHQTVGFTDIGGGLDGLDETGMTTEDIDGAKNFEALGYNVDSIVRVGVTGRMNAIGNDPSDGSVLIILSDGTIQRIVQNIDDGSIPPTLSATGTFSDLSTMTPNFGVVPYDLNLRFWSDHAIKTRFFAFQDGASLITYSRDGFWGFPEGSVWVKHFDMDLNRDSPGTNIKRLETRFLVKTADDFYGLTYKWNDAGTDADLVDANGENIDLTIQEDGQIITQTWRYPSRGECRACHTTDNAAIVGFSTRQLNREATLNGSAGNFLELMEDAGYLSPLDDIPENLPKYYRPDEASINVEDRVRSYLAVNCAYCHYEGNVAVPSSWQADPDLSLEDTLLLHGVAHGASSIVDSTDRLIIPGNTTKSIILNRAAESNGYSRMPPLASNVIDQEGVDLIIDWINNYANAKPVLGSATGPHAITENTAASTAVGASPTATDQDSTYSLEDRGTLTYSIVSGNDSGYFSIDPSTGALSLAQQGPDYEEGDIQTLTIKVSDGFAPNPGEATTDVAIHVSDILNDDTQGDGIEDMWAVTHFGFSMIDPLNDSDNDGSIELFEYWADSDPNDSASKGFSVLTSSTGYVSTPGQEGYEFEWIIRSELTAGVDYLIKGSSTLEGFTTLTKDVDYTEVLSESAGSGLTRKRIKVLTTGERYFLRIENP
ncbi:PQQ-dependent sugar dehydrogenase [Rubritalea sp.]|uniref:PQQ-dependent sugar dehydrogenase n=1 Tax=Rubritalea sp. TaxID=2109375 RepID=UPI003EF29A06